MQKNKVVSNHKNEVTVLEKILLNPKSKLLNFRGLSLQEKVEVMSNIPEYIQYEIFIQMNPKEIAETLECLETDDIINILKSFSEEKKDKILENIKEDKRENLKHLFDIDPDSAIGIMSTNFVIVDIDDFILEIAKQIKLHVKRTGKPPSIIVLEKNKFVGYMPVYELGFVGPGTPIRRYVRAMPYVYEDADHQEILDVFHRKPQSRIVILSKSETVIGIIHSEDILSFLKGKEASSLYSVAGIQRHESAFDSPNRKYAFRSKWLAINLATSFLAAFTVSLFEATLTKYVFLAIYMPIIAGMGGNAATQTLAVMVRAISLDRVSLRKIWPVLRNELISGFYNGVTNGILIAMVSYLFSRNIGLSIVLGLSMVISLFIAAFFGTLVPVIMQKLGKDPASSATVIITTATDVIGFFSFFALAVIILPRFADVSLLSII